ncbi:MAG: dTMP kinase [Rickettsiales bacterium]|nr:dTMP kinase [Rickettsiales bacterium]
MNDFSFLRGKFITFEGVEGAGKSTQSKILVEFLNKNGANAVWTREPGGCPEAEEIRNFVVTGSVNKMDGIAELLLMCAARRLHTEKKIKPLLASGATVVSDRYFDSSLAYQGFGHGISQEKIDSLRKITLDGFAPDLTLVLDLDVEEGLRRTSKRKETASRFENMDIEFHRRVRDGFNYVCETDGERCLKIDASKSSVEELQKIIWEDILGFFGRK